MNHGVRTLVYPVKDLDKAKGLYSRLLGAVPYVDSPYYVGWKVGEMDIGLDPNGHEAGLTGPVCYYHVDDINTSLQALLEAGAQYVQAIRDVGDGSLIASFKDKDGNLFGLLQQAASQAERNEA